VRQKLCNRVLELERINAAALDAMRNREQRAEVKAWLEDLIRQTKAWRATNSGPEHKSESLMDTLARSLGVPPREFRAQLMERAHGAGLR